MDLAGIRALEKAFAACSCFSAIFDHDALNNIGA
jgi:hypothetical protein